MNRPCGWFMRASQFDPSSTDRTAYCVVARERGERLELATGVFGAARWVARLAAAEWESPRPSGGSDRRRDRAALPAAERRAAATRPTVRQTRNATPTRA